jgi:eukaryotic-like serine/threonine-protein kinase
LFNRELPLVTALRSKSWNPSTIELDIWLVMQAVKSSPGSFRFGPFELDTRSGDLLDNGTTQRLADQPLALLIALLERPGELITRDELRQRLWPDGTFVDFDHGLNSAVNRLREALHDTANSPRVVETVPRRGYRLLVPVTSPGAQPLESSEGLVPALPASTDTNPTSRSHRLAWTGVAVAVIVAAGAAGVRYSRPDPGRTPQLANVAIELPADWTILNQSPAISPDSRFIVFSGIHRDGRRGLLMRPLGSGAAHVLPLTEDGSDPFWAPDGATVGFFAEGKLKLLPLAGGPPRIICDAPADSGGTFLSPGIVLFGPGPAGTIMQVDVERGTLRNVTTLDAGAGDRRHVRPMALPDGRHFVHLAQRQDGFVAVLATIGGPQVMALGAVQSQVLPTRSGHVLFVRDGILLAQKLDLAAGRLTGDATVLAQDLTVPSPGRFFDGRFSASSDMLVYIDSKVSTRADAELALFDRAGQRQATVGEPAGYYLPSFSPDGSRLAVARREGQSLSRDIWVFDLARGTRLRLTLEKSDETGPEWSSDGLSLLYTSDLRGERDIYKRPASGEGPGELVFESRISKSVNAWSPDGQFIVYDTGGRGFTPDLYVLPLSGNRQPRVINAAPGFQNQADISPDGGLIAYASSESGKWEVIVETFPEKGGRWQISTGGGRNPCWRGDGRELFFTSGDDVMAVDVHAGRTMSEWGGPRRLFTVPGLLERGVDVSPDGQRLAVVVGVSQEPQRLTTLLNWTTQLK